MTTVVFQIAYRHGHFDFKTALECFKVLLKDSSCMQGVVCSTYINESTKVQNLQHQKDMPAD